MLKIENLCIVIINRQSPLPEAFDNKIEQFCNNTLVWRYQGDIISIYTSIHRYIYIINIYLLIQVCYTIFILVWFLSTALRFFPELHDQLRPQIDPCILELQIHATVHAVLP